MPAAGFLGFLSSGVNVFETGVSHVVFSFVSCLLAPCSMDSLALLVFLVGHGSLAVAIIFIKTHSQPLRPV